MKIQTQTFAVENDSEFWNNNASPGKCQNYHRKKGNLQINEQAKCLGWSQWRIRWKFRQANLFRKERLPGHQYIIYILSISIKSKKITNKLTFDRAINYAPINHNTYFSVPRKIESFTVIIQASLSHNIFVLDGEERYVGVGDNTILDCQEAKHQPGITSVEWFCR